MIKKSMYLPAALTVILIIVTAMMGTFDLMVQKWTAFIAVVAMLAFMVTKQGKNALKVYTTPLFLAVCAYVIWNGVSVFYAAVTKLALFEYTKLLVAAAVFFAVLLFTAPSKKGVKTVSFIFALSTAFFGIVSIDAASNGPIAALFKSFMGLFTDSMQNFGIFENGIRITGIFGNANTFSGYMALGILLSIFLVLNSSAKKHRILAMALLSVNALAYILLFSLGSLFIFFISCILMIAISQKGQRLATFMLMAEASIITLFFAAVSLISLGTSPIVPLAAILLNALACWLADNYLRQPLTDKLSEKSKGGMITGIVIAVLLIGYIAAALNVTGSLTLTPSETVMRGAYLDEGAYELSDFNGTATTVRITSQNNTDLKVHTSSELYNGSLESARFTVPADSEIVKIYFTGMEPGSTINELSLKNTTSGKTENIKLDYKLLPAIAANRIQDLWANENSVQRLVFFEDGMKLFKQSPLIGQGLAGYETGVSSVQNFFYETRYVHNHYIQALCDLGIVGLALFMGILVLCGISIVKLFRRCVHGKYRNAGAFALPVLAASLLQMFGQAVTDLTWSAGPFLLIAFGMLALLIVVDSKAFVDVPASDAEAANLVSEYAAVLDVGLKGKISGATAARVVVGILSLTMTVLLTLNLYAHYKASSGNCTMDEIATLTKIDKLESDDYKTTYIVNASTYGLSENFEQANQYADELKGNTSAVLEYLLPYYFNTGQDDKLYETAALAAHNGRSSGEIWNRLFEIFDTAFDTNRDDPAPVIVHLFSNKEYYIDGLIGLYEELKQRNNTYLDEVQLDPSNVVFMSKLLGIQNLSNVDLLKATEVFSKTIFDSNFAVDANNDYIPDNVKVIAGNALWGQGKTKSGFDGTLQAEAGTVLDLEAYCVKGDSYTLRFEGLTNRDVSVTFAGNAVPLVFDSTGASAIIPLKGADEAAQKDNTQVVTGATETISVTFPTDATVQNITIKR